jgi:hypothetical protein
LRWLVLQKEESYIPGCPFLHVGQAIYIAWMRKYASKTRSKKTMVIPTKGGTVIC